MSDISANGQGAAAPQGPTLMINAQYLRDLSFENPRAPESLMAGAPAPAVNIDLDVKARQMNEETYESVLVVKIEAKQDQQTAFMVEAEYGAVVTIRNATQEMVAALLLVETPRLLFPFVRNIISEATRDGGFPPLLINPIDFTELQRRKALAAQAGGAPERSDA